MIQRALKRMRSLREEAAGARETDYKQPYLDGVDACIDLVENLMWEEGVDEED